MLSSASLRAAIEYCRTAKIPKGQQGLKADHGVEQANEGSLSIDEMCQTLICDWQKSSEENIIEIPPAMDSGKHTATIIFTHGLGDTGNGWVPAFQHMPRFFPHVKVVLPTALSIPVTLNMGMVMPAWYDIEDLGANRLAMNAAGIEHAATLVQALIHTEAQLLGGKYGRIIVGGFSQGGAVSLLAGHSFEEKLGGFVALSSYVAAADHFKKVLHDANKSTPLFMAHGDSDPMVDPAIARASFEFLQQTVKDPKEVASMKWYPMEHEACVQEIQDMYMFLKERIPPQ